MLLNSANTDFSTFLEFTARFIEIFGAMTLIPLFLGLIPAFLHWLHIFQLNGYDMAEHKIALKKLPKEKVFWIFTAFVSALFGRHFVLWKQAENPLFIYNILFLIIITILSGSLYFCIFKKKKKPLKFTHRTLRLCLTSFLILCVIILAFIAFCYFKVPYTLIHSNTRVFDLAFIPLFSFFAVFAPVIANFLNTPFETANRARYIRSAKQKLSELPELTIIGITGSYGKTSTKFYLKDILSVKYNVFATPKSFNTTMGVVKVIRENLDRTHDIFICEMGAKKVGEIKEICDIVHPKHAIITSVGPQHLETFKSIENVSKTKFELADSVKDGHIVLNSDNEYIIKKAGNYKNSVLYGEKNADYNYNIISVSSSGTKFIVTTKSGEKEEFETALLGKHTVMNLAASIAIANLLGISLSEMKLPIKRLKPVSHRLELISSGSDLIIDDAFNSNPKGAAAALSVLELFNNHTKIIITPGMVELGSEEEKYNKEFGVKIAAVADYALLVGKDLSGYIADGLKEAGFPDEKVIIFSDVKTAISYARGLQVIFPKVILLENDLPDNFR